MSNEFEQMGYTWLSKYDKPGRRANNDDHSPEYKILRRAIKDGHVEAIQMGGSGRWLVRKESADKFLARQPKPAKAEPSCTKQSAVLQGISSSKTDISCDLLEDIGSKLSGLIDRLGRIADAAESIATQPKPAQREFFNVTDTNSFHN